MRLGCYVRYELEPMVLKHLNISSNLPSDASIKHTICSGVSTSWIFVIRYSILRKESVGLKCARWYSCFRGVLMALRRCPSVIKKPKGVFVSVLEPHDFWLCKSGSPVATSSIIKDAFASESAMCEGIPKNNRGLRQTTVHLLDSGAITRMTSGYHRINWAW